MTQFRGFLVITQQFLHGSGTAKQAATSLRAPVI